MTDVRNLYSCPGRRYYLFVWAYASCNSTNAADFLLKVMNYFPFPILAINTDNGPEYLLNFHKKCEELGITHYFNYQYDLLPNLEDIRERCGLFNDKYNNRRFHHAIGYKTPSEYVTNYLQERGGISFSI